MSEPDLASSGFTVSELAGSYGLESPRAAFDAVTSNIKTQIQQWLCRRGAGQVFDPDLTTGEVERRALVPPRRKACHRGRYDATGWHAASDRKRVRHLRSYQLPLVA